METFSPCLETSVLIVLIYEMVKSQVKITSELGIWGWTFYCSQVQVKYWNKKNGLKIIYKLSITFIQLGAHD